MTKFISIVIAVIFSVQPAWSHGVHDSGQAKPQKGGVLRSLETIHLELVSIGKEIRIYIFNKDKKPKPLKTTDYQASAKVILPRGKGSQKVELIGKDGYWLTSYDAKGLHRYDLEFSIKQAGHDDKILFTIETKK